MFAIKIDNAEWHTEAFWDLPSAMRALMELWTGKGPRTLQAIMARYQVVSFTVDGRGTDEPKPVVNLIYFDTQGLTPPTD